jgi:hypothetical protein
MALKDKLHDTKMAKGESVASYLTQVAQVKYELVVVGEVISDSELVRIALKGWSRLWDDFTQEEIREGSQSSGQKGDGVDEENVSLATKRKSKKQGSSGKDLSKVICFVCNQYGHLATQCPEKKKKRKEKEGPVATTTTTVEDFSDKFEKEFSLVTLVSSVRSTGFVRDSRWIIDNGASCHMTGIWHIFLSITETGPDRLVESEGGMAREVRGVGRVRFQLKFGELLVVDGVLFVLGLRVNLLSVSTLADVGYATLFKSGHVFIYREGADPIEPQLIGDRVDRLYIV